MNKEQKKEELIKIRNKLSEIFNDSKEDWSDKWWCSSLVYCMGNLDDAISKISLSKPTGIKAL
jgi:hypothetical protein